MSRLIIIELKRKRQFMRYYDFDWLDFLFKSVVFVCVFGLIALVITAIRAPSERATYTKLDKDHELVCVKKTGWGFFVEPYYEKCVNWLEVSK